MYLQMNYYLILIIREWAQSHSWLVEAENITVPVLDLIGQFPAKMSLMWGYITNWSSGWYYTFNSDTKYKSLTSLT